MDHYLILIAVPRVTEQPRLQQLHEGESKAAKPWEERREVRVAIGVMEFHHVVHGPTSCTLYNHNIILIISTTTL